MQRRNGPRATLAQGETLEEKFASRSRRKIDYEEYSSIDKEPTKCKVRGKCCKLIIDCVSIKNHSGGRDGKEYKFSVSKTSATL